MILLDGVVIGVAAVVGVPVAVLAAEVWLAVIRGPRGGKAAMATGARPRVGVVIPAHNEEGGIGATLSELMPQLRAGDEVIVVADNCTDRTAEVARGGGAQVVERKDDRRGKGYALAAGVEALTKSAPEVVIVLDADTPPSENCIDALACAVRSGGGPVQGLYLMNIPARASTKSRISALAFCFKNHVRAIGADRLGIPCLLRGTGMAFPWGCLSSARLASGNIVEDMQLGMDLVLTGSPPGFCAGALVKGELPAGSRVAAVQRTRWEHGHLQTLLRNVPRLIWRGLTTGRAGCIGLALDLAVPPLALLCMFWGALMCVSCLGWAVNLCSGVPTVLVGAIGALLMTSILAGWARFARHLLGARDLLAIPLYVLWKVPLYAAFIWKRQQSWIRTERAS